MYSSYPYTYIQLFPRSYPYTYVCMCNCSHSTALYCYCHQITELTVNLKSARGKDREVSSSRGVQSSEWSEVIAAKDQELLQMKKKLSRMENQLCSVGVEKDKKTVSKLTKVEITYTYIHTYVFTYVYYSQKYCCVCRFVCMYVRTYCAYGIFVLHAYVHTYSIYSLSNTAVYCIYSTVRTYVRTYSSVTHCSCLCVHVHTYVWYLHAVYLYYVHTYFTYVLTVE